MVVMYSTLISVARLQDLMGSGAPLLVFDCSYDLMNPAAGGEQYLHAHLPGAVHADLGRNLSAHGEAPRSSGGRHPLPERAAFAAWLASRGLDSGQQVVVYDRQGVNHCGRLWWMLKWCGHEPVAVLDGGLQAWEAAGGALENGPARQRPSGNFSLQVSRARTVDTAGVVRALGSPEQTLIDARAHARFRGDIEPLDPVAGHIPGALNRPFGQNFGPGGLFKPAHELRAEFEALLAGRDAASVVHQCGSGVSAIPNLLAMEVAGLGRTTLYPGSWSEWCRTPGLPCARA